MTKYSQSGSSASPRSEAPIKPKVEMTFHDLAVSRRIMHDGNNDGSTFEAVNETNGWRQYNFYFSIKQDGRYIDPSSFKIINDGDFKYKDFPDENGSLFLISAKNGYQTRAYIWPMGQTSAIMRFWPDAKYSQQVITSNGDKHAFCITYIAFFSLRPCTYTDSRPMHVEFMIDSNRYTFCPSYFIPETIKDLEHLINADNADDKVVDTLIDFNSTSAKTPKPNSTGISSGVPFSVAKNKPMCVCRSIDRNVYAAVGKSNMRDGNHWELVVTLDDLSDDRHYQARNAICPVQYGINAATAGEMRLISSVKDLNQYGYSEPYNPVNYRYAQEFRSEKELNSKGIFPKGNRLQLNCSSGSRGPKDPNILVMKLIPNWNKNAFYIWDSTVNPDKQGYVRIYDYSENGCDFLQLAPYLGAEDEMYVWQFRDQPVD